VSNQGSILKLCVNWNRSPIFARKDWHWNYLWTIKAYTPELYNPTSNRTFVPKEFNNGDTRSNYWPAAGIYCTRLQLTGREQYTRSRILFRSISRYKIAFDLVQGLRNIFNTANVHRDAYTKLGTLVQGVENTDLRAFNHHRQNTITLNYRSILTIL